MGKNLTSIPGTSGPSHPLQSTIQPILGVLEQFWPKNLAEQANPTASPAPGLMPQRRGERKAESAFFADSPGSPEDRAGSAFSEDAPPSQDPPPQSEARCSLAAPASSRGPGEGGGSAPWDPGLGSVVVSMRSMTAPRPLVDMALCGERVPSRATRRRWLQGGSAREWRRKSFAVLSGALAAGR